MLEQGEFRHLAIANPRLAPYGQAARETLQAMGLWERLQGQLVRGENISQAFQFVVSQNAEIGLVAHSQLVGPQGSHGGSFWVVPESLHGPIEQQGVLLRDSEAGRDFMRFLRSGEAAELMRAHGYEVPGATGLSSEGAKR